MSNYKKVKIQIETTGYLYTSDETNQEEWLDYFLEESQVKITNFEVVEEYVLPPHLAEYVNSEDFNLDLESEIERELLIQRRNKRIDTIIDKDNP